MIGASSTSLKAVIEQLIAEKRLAPDKAGPISAAVSTPAAEEANPWYIQALVGLAAWLAALPFIGFLFNLGLIDSPAGMLILGGLFCLFAVGLRRFMRRSLFVAQLALAFSLAGQILLAGGTEEATDSPRAAAVALIILELVLIAVYPDGLHRFLSTLVIPAAILFILFDLNIQEAGHGLVIALAAGGVVLWKSESYLAVNAPENLYRPVAYGVVVSLLYVLLLSIAHVFERPPVEVDYWWASATGLLAILLALEYFILTSPPVRAARSVIGLITVGTLIVFLPTLQAPGILAAALVLMLGFHRGNLLLLSLAAAFLALFLIVFYYNLALTLLTKSFILTATGLAFLGLRFLLLNRLAAGEGRG